MPVSRLSIITQCMAFSLQSHPSSCLALSFAFFFQACHGGKLFKTHALGCEGRGTISEGKMAQRRIRAVCDHFLGMSGMKRKAVMELSFMSSQPACDVGTTHMRVCY